MKALAAEFNLNILYGARLRDGSNLYNSVALLSPETTKCSFTINSAWCLLWNTSPA